MLMQTSGKHIGTWKRPLSALGLQKKNSVPGLGLIILEPEERPKEGMAILFSSRERFIFQKGEPLFYCSLLWINKITLKSGVYPKLAMACLSLQVSLLSD